MKLELKDQKNMVSASDLFNNLQSIFFWDYRCLVPYSHKDPTKWKTYEMHDYRKASSEKELKKVDRFKHDNNLFNWKDPKVLKYFVQSRKSYKKAMKKTYGFPYAFPYGNVTNVGLSAIYTKCWRKCARYVSSYLYTYYKFKI